MEAVHHNSRQHSTGFALSGGFVKGFAHLGVIQGLLECDIKPDILQGVSVGALVGAFYADGKEPYKILEIFRPYSFKKLVKLSLPRIGFLDIAELTEIIRSNLTHNKLEDLPLPLIVTATNFDLGCSVHFQKGDIADCVSASCCMPILFKPKIIDGTHYVDGGIIKNLPVAPLKQICEKVVAINLCPLEVERFKMNILGVALRSYHFLLRANSYADREIADLFLEPDLSKFSLTNMERGEDIFLTAYKYTKDYLKLLQESNGTYCRN